MLTHFQQILETQPYVFYSLVILFSLVIGSFLNVVIHRLPKMLQQEWTQDCKAFLAQEDTQKEDQNNNKHEDDNTADSLNHPNITLSTPHSSCPHCNHKIRFYENIPVLSWLFLQGKCSQCKKAISIRYPLVETFTAALSVVVAYYYGPTLLTLALLLLTWGLVCLTLIDFDHMLLPDQITLPLLWLGLLVNLDASLVSLHDAVIGAVVGYMSLYSIFWLFKLITGKEGMGYGDFKLVALFGAWMGWQLLPLLILMASLVGAIVGISLMAFKGHQREQAIPFGPYLAIAGWITLLWGDALWGWYLSYLV